MQWRGNLHKKIKKSVIGVSLLFLSISMLASCRSLTDTSQNDEHTEMLYFYSSVKTDYEDIKEDVVSMIPAIIYLEIIDFEVAQQISIEMPFWNFRLLGEREGSARIHINSLIITDNYGSLIQEITGLSAGANNIGDETWWWQEGVFTQENLFGLRFVDFNFDGYLDIALQNELGGSARNSPSYFWLWDNETVQFVRNAQLVRISLEAEVFAIPQTQRIDAVFRVGVLGNGVTSHEYVDGGLVAVKRVTPGFHPEYGAVYYIEELNPITGAIGIGD